MESLYVNAPSIWNNGIAQRAVRRVKEGTAAMPLQFGLDKIRWADSMECYCYLRTFQDLIGRQNSSWSVFSWTNHWANNSFVSIIENHLICAKDQVRLYKSGNKVLSGIYVGHALLAEGNLERRYSGRGRWGGGKFGRVRNPCSETLCQGG